MRAGGEGKGLGLGLGLGARALPCTYCSCHCFTRRRYAASLCQRNGGDVGVPGRETSVEGASVIRVRQIRGLSKWSGPVTNGVTEVLVEASCPLQRVKPTWPNPDHGRGDV